MSHHGTQEIPKTREINFKHKSYSLLRVPVAFSHLKTFALIDTGAAASFISDEYLAMIPDAAVLNEFACTTKRVFQSAAGEKMPVTGIFQLLLQLSPECSVHHTFYVLPKLEEGCILGIDFLHLHKITLDVTNKEMRLGSEENLKIIKLNQLKKKTFPLYRVVDQPRIEFDIKHIKELPVRNKILGVLVKFMAIFASKLTELGKTNVLKHEIPTNGTAVSVRPFKTPFALRPFLEKQLIEMEKHGIIERSTSPYRAQLLMVKKKSGELRLCNDFRNLNSVTIKDRYPLPVIEDILHLLHGAKLFTTLDLFSGYWQIEIADEDKFKTAFSCEFGHFQYARMPFGLCNAPSSFQRAMEIILRPIINKFVMVYIDDIIVFSKNIQDHIYHLEQVFTLLLDAGLKIKIQKCKFARSEVEYLGHIVSKEGVKVDPAKVKAVRNFPIPKKMEHIRSFLGIAGYYRKFIDQFADIVHVLTQLTRSKVQWHWGTEEQTAFDKIKELLCSAPVLAYPDFAQPFIIHTDACGYGVGGILSQMPTPSSEPASEEESVMDSKEHPIAYTSKHLNDLQIKWCTTEKEAFAIYHTVKAFFPYLFGTTFTIVTDHASLKYLMGKREPTGRLARWSLYLQQFDMEIHYRPGKLHQNADALSRCPVYAIVTPRYFVDDWIIAQQEDKFCKVLMQKNTGNARPEHFGEEDSFKILPNGLWATAREKIVVPMEFQKEIMVRFHDHKLAAHMGIEKTLANIRNKYFWPKMARDVRTHVTNCLICAKRKAAKACKAPLQPFPIAEYLWQRVAMDIVGPVIESYRGSKYILVLMEYVTRYVIAFPLKDTTAQTIVKKLIKHVITKEGIPAQILTDQGSNFQSETMAELCKQLGTKQIRTTSYHPQTDGAVERFNQTLGNMLTTHVHNNPREWDEHLNYIIAAYNRTPHSSTGETPFFLLKGRDAIEPTDLRPPMRNRILEDQNNVYAQQWQEAIELAKANLIIAQERQKHYYDRSLQECSFEPNDVVLLKILKAQKGKFNMRWKGPYVVIEKLSNLNYLIRHQDDTYPVVVHVNRMRKWRGETKFNEENSDTDTEETTTTTHTTPEEENTAATTTHDAENNPNTTNANHQSTLDNTNKVVDPINGDNIAVSNNIETTVDNEIRVQPAEINETTPPTVLPEEPQGVVKRKRGRPRKDPTAPKNTIIPTPHTYNLRKTIRLPQ